MTIKYIFAAASAATLVVLNPAAARAGNADSGPGPMTRVDAVAKAGERFARADLDKDGFVTEAEIKSRMDQKMARMKARAEKRAANFSPDRMFERLDADKDGRLTKAEVEAAHGARVARSGKAAKAAHAGKPSRSERLFDRADANRDGLITRAELTAMPRPDPAKLAGRGAKMGHMGMMGRMLSTADLDKDGRISAAEAQQAAVQRFDRADSNRDGMLTPEERKAAREARRAKRSG